MIRPRDWVAASIPFVLNCLWIVGAGAVVLVAPSLILFGILPWRLSQPESLQIAVAVMTYFVVAAYGWGVRRNPPPRIEWRLVLWTAVMFGVAYAVLGLLPEISPSRKLLGVSAVLSAVLAVQPFLRGFDRSRLGSIAALVVVIALARFAAKADAAGDHAPVRRWTALAQIEIRYQSGLAGPAEEGGGGLARWTGGFHVITGRGALYRLEWDSTATLLHSKRREIPPLIDRKTYLADLGGDTLRAPPLRVIDITFDSLDSPPRLYVAYQHWNHEARCFTLRVSSIAMRAGVGAVESRWRDEFETHPCVAVVSGFDGAETGGRFAWTRDRALLLSTGDYGINGLTSRPLAQDPDADYGKVLRRDTRTRKWESFTLGHRNPSGLMVDSDGRVWETEHGPQGGDEINILNAGNNYGWPYATYGTDYGRAVWPLAPEGRNHGRFTEPAFAFVPSIAISNLVEVRGDLFPEWRGDLLVGSLRSQSIWRVRRRGDRILYVEQIPIGRRVRDIIESPDGRLILWTDRADVVIIGRPARTESPKAAFAQCEGCHEPSREGITFGPQLRGMLGRRVAAQRGFDYSAALRALGGTWTTQRLDAFLRDPDSFAPGTAMRFRVDNPEERRLIIEYLRNYR